MGEAPEERAAARVQRGAEQRAGAGRGGRRLEQPALGAQQRGGRGGGGGGGGAGEEAGGRGGAQLGGLEGRAEGEEGGGGC